MFWKHMHTKGLIFFLEANLVFCKSNQVQLLNPLERSPKVTSWCQTWSVIAPNHIWLRNRSTTTLNTNLFLYLSKQSRPPKSHRKQIQRPLLPCLQTFCTSSCSAHGTKISLQNPRTSSWHADLPTRRKRNPAPKFTLRTWEEKVVNFAHWYTQANSVRANLYAER